VTARAVAPLVLLLLGLGACGRGQSAPADTGPSVLVTTRPVAQGSLPSTVTAYGSAAPALNGQQTLSVPQPGQVTGLAVSDGMAVRAGEPLLTFTLAPTAHSTYQQAADALAAAEKQRASTQALFAQQLATHDQLAQADKAVMDAQAAVTALSAEGAGRPVQTLRAPFDGVVTTVSVAQGDRTQAGAPLLTVARTTGLLVSAGVDPAERPHLRVGASATLERLAGGPPVTGHVVRVDSALDPKTRMIPVDMAFPAGALLPGEGMRATIVTGQATGWVVPHQAVVTAKGPPRVFQVVAGHAKAVLVRIALSSPDGDVVQGPLVPSHPLIVDGAYQVSDGDAVRSGGQ